MMTINDFWQDIYMQHISGLRECTRIGYESAYRIHIKPALGDIQLDQLTVQTVEQWLHSIPSVGAARKAYAVLRQMLRLAVRYDIITMDITPRVSLPKAAHYEPPTLSIDQIRQLLQGFYGHELEAWLLCSICLGLRTEEALGLEWSDIDLRSGTVHVQRGIQYLQGKIVVVEPKTELSNRTIILPKFAVQRLREIKTSGRLTGTLTPPQVARKYKQHCTKHNLPYVACRNLRHSWASTALSAGVDVAVVSRMLGHSSITTTARYYLRPQLQAYKDAQAAWQRSLIK